MRKLCIGLGTFVFGYVFWEIPDRLGASFFVSFMISGLGSVFGVWAGWKLALKLEE